METTHTAGNIMGTSTTQDGWSGLPDDLLATVFARLDSPLDHVRFAAVCSSWRAFVSTRPPHRVHPWLVMDPQGGGETKRVYCPGDGVVMPLATCLNKAGGRCFVGCHAGGWVAYEAPLCIMNVFSGAELALPMDQIRPFVTRKVIFSESPTSNGCIVAAITDNHEVVICGVGSPESGWMARRFCGQQVEDITFCNGHLYCIMEHSYEVTKFELSLDKSGLPVFGAIHWMPIQYKRFMRHFYDGGPEDPDVHGIYIFELHGRLAMAVRRTFIPWSQLRSIRGPFFVVFKLVDVDIDGVTTERAYHWVDVRSMGDHALFLGRTCSKAIPVSTREHNGPRRNHIYYSHHRCYIHKKHVPNKAEEFFTSSNKDGCWRVCYRENESVNYNGKGISSVGYYTLGGAQPPMWLFPQDL